MPMECT